MELEEVIIDKAVTFSGALSCRSRRLNAIVMAVSMKGYLNHSFRTADFKHEVGHIVLVRIITVTLTTNASILASVYLVNEYIGGEEL